MLCGTSLVGTMVALMLATILVVATLASESNHTALNLTSRPVPGRSVVQRPSAVQVWERTITQFHPPWGLSALSNKYDPSVAEPYRYLESAGEGVTVYVINTGIDVAHSQFGGRAETGYDATLGRRGVTYMIHGTKVASVIGGSTFGVAKKVNLISVQGGTDWIFDDEDIVRALEWVIHDIAAKGRVNSSLVNFSGQSDTDCDGYRNGFLWLVNQMGVPVVVAAGNEQVSASTVCPANITEVITVGAIDKFYRRVQLTNWGSAIDIYGPGLHIEAALPGENWDDILGLTSLATAHVTGVLAYLIAKEGYRTPSEWKEQLQELAIADYVDDTRGSPNFLVYNGIGY